MARRGRAIAEALKGFSSSSGTALGAPEPGGFPAIGRGRLARGAAKKFGKLKKPAPAKSSLVDTPWQGGGSFGGGSV